MTDAPKLQMWLLNILEHLEWGMKHFGSAGTGRNHRRRDMMKAVSQGFAESIGDVLICDGDGFVLEPERYGEGFVLTEKGKAELARIRLEHEEGAA